MTLFLTRQDFLRAQQNWLDQSQELHALVGSLDEIDTGLLGSRVGPVLDSFLGTWRAESEALRGQAEGYADRLAAALSDYNATDATAFEAMSGLLPAGAYDPEA